MTGNIKTLVLPGGTSDIIPKNIKILSVATTGDVTLTSSCPTQDVSVTDTYGCFAIDYVTSDGGTGAFQPVNTLLLGYRYNGKTVLFESSVVLTATSDTIEAAFTESADGNIFQYVGEKSMGTDDAVIHRRILLSMPTKVGEDFYVLFNEIKGLEMTEDVKPFEVSIKAQLCDDPDAVDCCPVPEVIA